MLGGIFVGGAGKRMNGAAKGLLRVPDGETIVAHVASAMREVGVEPVLVGTRAEYDATGMASIADAMANAGPLGGLVALLDAARGERAIAVACDMPYVSAPLLRKLATAPDAAIVAPRRDGRWEPLFARYDASRVLGVARARCARGELALQGLLDEVGATPLALTQEDEARLADWDAPGDMRSDPTFAAATVERSIVVFDGGRSSARDDRIAVEAPLEIRNGREPVAVTMRTPGADVDLAAGFLLGEGIVRARDDVIAIGPGGPNAVVVDLADAARARLERADRRFWITSSCGVCGKESIDRIRATLPAKMPDQIRFDPRTLAKMPNALREAQSIFERTGALHAAGLFDARGVLVRFAEDVGRHNAVDKVLGAELLAGRVPLTDHALVLSGRIAFELVQKAALAGITAIVAIGAPTSLAVELAEEAGMTLIGFARGERFNVYAGASRVARET